MAISKERRSRMPDSTDRIEDENRAPDSSESEQQQQENANKPPVEIGGRRDGSDPIRFGDWEKNGRCIDF